MEWTEAISKAIRYIETHITEDITIDDISKEICISPFYFQKGFSLLCGVTISEYIRNRRLSLAGNELATSDKKVIDVALKYGYDSPDSFTKAFTRFHGITPSMVQKNEEMLIKTYAPLKIKLSMEGGYIMDYKIVKKEEFTVLGAAKTFTYEEGKEKVPEYWKEHYAAGNGQYVCGMYGINIDEEMGHDTFEYLIADNYNPMRDIPEGFITKTIPAFTWAVFPCKGALPDSLQNVNAKIFSEWLPALKDYEFAAGYCIEMYDDASKYNNGIQDENYYRAIWIPVKEK
ncbi:MAG: AraC family transcriptional regulator [Lachnospiraceae bacterium]|nr:AraC family transcriptional regulator [Lachnospiraceae bacterium]